MNKQVKKEITLELAFQIPPTVPPISWAEARADYKRGPILGSPAEAADYFRKYIGGRTKEAFLSYVHGPPQPHPRLRLHG